MRIETITPATEQPVTLTEAKDHVVVGDGYDDELLEGYLATAGEWAERYLNKTIITTTLRIVLDGFPNGPIHLPRGPVQSVKSVKYISASTGRENTLPITCWTLTGNLLAPALGKTWPATREFLDAVRIEYVAGNEAEEVNPIIRQAILLKVGQLFLQREEVGPTHLRRSHMTAENLLDSVRERQLA